QVEPRAFVLLDLMADVRRSLAEKAEENHVKIMLESRGALPEKIVTDRARLRQILLNVAGNAIRYTKDGTVFLTMKYSPSRTDQQHSKITFTIRDTGRGMTPEQAAGLFRPSAQGEPYGRHRFAGAGLGL